jgi:glucosamine-6-phosphate deaminase
MSLDLVIVDDEAALSRAGADWVAARVLANPAAVLLLATGSTPMGLYAELAARRRQGTFDPSRLRVFQLDAYLGLGPGDPRSLYGWMKRSFLDPLAISPERVTRLPGDASDPAAAARAFDRAIAAAGGLDLAVLGLGPNGHLGFNAPPAGAAAPTRVIDLTEASLESNARYWGGRERVPRQALTTGMAQILAARQILLVVSGAHKHAILHKTVEGPVSPAVPASFLQWGPATIIADRSAWLGPGA